MRMRRHDSHWKNACALSVMLLGVLATNGVRAAETKPVAVYGYIQGDFILDFKRVDPNWNATLRPSKIPVNCPGDAGCGTDGETIFSVRQTRIGMKGDVTTDAGAVNVLLEADFFESTSLSRSEGIRLSSSRD